MALSLGKVGIQHTQLDVCIASKQSFEQLLAVQALTGANPHNLNLLTMVASKKSITDLTSAGGNPSHSKPLTNCEGANEKSAIFCNGTERKPMEAKKTESYLAPQKGRLYTQ